MIEGDFLTEHPDKIDGDNDQSITISSREAESQLDEPEGEPRDIIYQDDLEDEEELIPLSSTVNQFPRKTARVSKKPVRYEDEISVQAEISRSLKDLKKKTLPNTNHVFRTFTIKIDPDPDYPRNRRQALTGIHRRQ